MQFIAPLRRRVIGLLDLARGDHVLDMGSGTGASFEALRGAVGPTGRITGVELSEEMAAVARQRIADRGWTNVEVIVGDARTARLPHAVDGIFFFLVHDLTRMPDVVGRVVGRAIAKGRPDARLVAFGPVSAPRWAVPVNLIVRALSARYVTSFDGFDAPWSYLAKRSAGAAGAAHSRRRRLRRRRPACGWDVAGVAPRRLALRAGISRF